MASTSYVFRRFYPRPNISDGGNIWTEGPTREGIIVYSVITPIICLVGICGNTISVVVLSRKELKYSAFVYLSVLSFTGLCSSILLFLSGLSAGILFSDDWPVYDVLFGLPLSGIFNTIGVLVTVMVSLDRLICMYNPIKTITPRFCRVCVARRVVMACIIFAVIVNIPTFFIFKSDEFGQLTTTALFYSSEYMIYNWIKFFLLGVFPSIFLIFSNGYLINTLRTIYKMKLNAAESVRNKKTMKFWNSTITLILVVFMFLISEIPALLTSRSSAATYFFDPKSEDDPCNSKSLETMRQISTVLTASSLAADFFLYCLFCPQFTKTLSKIMGKKRRNKRVKSVQMNVFVIDKQICLDKGIKSISALTPGKIFEIINNDPNNCRFEIDDERSSSTEPSDEDSNTAADNRKTLMSMCPKPSVD